MRIRRWGLGALAGATMALATVAVVGAAPARAEWGVKMFDAQLAASAAGGVYTQAGGHPYSLTTVVELNHHLDPDPGDLFTRFGEGGQVPEGGIVKDILVNSPPGLVGNPSITPHCTMAQLAGGGPINGLSIGSEPTCPIDSQVGVIALKDQANGAGLLELGTFPVYNMVPPPYAPARFGFQILGTTIVLDANVRNGGDLGITVVSHDIPEAFRLWYAALTLWGVPADPSHDAQRCDYSEFGFYHGACEGYSGPASEPHHAGVPPRAFLTLPTSCTGPEEGLEMGVRTDPWERPGAFATASLVTHLPPYFGEGGEPGAPLGTTDCGRVPFNPSISVQPTNHEADTPTGLEIEISLPQEGLLNPTGVATADVRKAVVMLPAGESISPSSADGLGACSVEQIGLESGQPSHCPDSSKLGTVLIETPLLEKPLTGSIYLGQPECSPCTVADDLAGRMVKIYVEAEGSGTIIKLPGRVELDPATGRIVTTFDNNPQLPFSHLHINFKAGPRSPIVNPHACGAYETEAEFTPWSGNPPVMLGSSFQITSGPGGGPCPSSTQQPFAPSFAAGTTSNQAAGFSPMTVTFARNDGEQQLGGVTVRTPPGLLGEIGVVSLCPEPAASLGSCPPDSEIGSLTVAAGAGANPFYVTGGKVFLTGGYKDAPFGLSIVVPAQAGPFDLGTVVVRGSISVDPTTAALTVTTDPLPTILDGIPLDLRMVHVDINHSRFIFNPTDCNPLSLSATLTGGLGTLEPVTNSFQVTNCAVLGFKPKFTVATSAHHTRADGASLDVKLSYPDAPFGTQTNIARVKVELPKQLPSRLTTLQKACPDSVFDANPEACPAASRVGAATANTPIIPEPFKGPAYFVSHGGAKFPELIIALHGYRLTVYLHGETFIDRAGITSTTFNAVPDVPIGSFELKLPAGSDSALAGNGDLCASKLNMPTEFTAQNGTMIKQRTPISVEGCAPEIRVIRHRVSGKRATVVVSVPSAGTLVADGGGVVRTARAVHKAGTVTLRLALSRSGQRFLARHHNRRLQVPITLSFRPSRGRQLSARVAVLMR